MEILLQKNELLDLGARVQGLKIVCTSGHCWITQSGDNRDHILRPGQSFSSGLAGRVIVTASEPCRLMLVAAPKLQSQLLPRQILSCNA